MDGVRTDSLLQGGYQYGGFLPGGYQPGGVNSAWAFQRSRYELSARGVLRSGDEEVVNHCARKKRCSAFLMPATSMNQ